MYLFLMYNKCSAIVQSNFAEWPYRRPTPIFITAFTFALPDLILGTIKI